MPPDNGPYVAITDEVVEHLTERLCGDTLAVIRTLREKDQGEYLRSMHERTRRALEEVADYGS